MTRRRTGPDRYQTTPAGAVTVALAVLATICLTVGVAAGPRAGLTLAALLVGLPCAAVAVLALLILATDSDTTALHRLARRRAGLDPVDVDAIEGQAVADFARRLDQEG